MARPDLRPVASLWIGDRLTWFERVAIQSFIDHGHRFILYAYDPIEGVPAEVDLRPADEIVPRPERDLSDRARRAIFSDTFRIEMILKTDAIWVDTDALCLAPFRPVDDCLFGIEKHTGVVSNAMLRLPSDAPVTRDLHRLLTASEPILPWLRKAKRIELRHARHRGERWDMTRFRWGESGPRALTFYLRHHGWHGRAFARHVLYPLNYPCNEALFRPEFERAAIEQRGSISVHFYGGTKHRMRELGQLTPQAGSYFAAVCARHGIDPAGHPLPELPAETAQER